MAKLLTLDELNFRHSDFLDEKFSNNIGQINTPLIFGDTQKQVRQILDQEAHSTVYKAVDFSTSPDKPTYSLTRMSTNETVSLPYSDELYFIGRSPEKCSYVVDNPLIARIHCYLTIHETTGVTINDMNSTNGSWINDRKLIPGHSYPIANNDILRLADETFVFRQMSDL